MLKCFFCESCCWKLDFFLKWHFWCWRFNLDALSKFDVLWDYSMLFKIRSFNEISQWNVGDLSNFVDKNSVFFCQNVVDSKSTIYESSNPVLLATAYLNFSLSVLFFCNQKKIKNKKFNNLNRCTLCHGLVVYGQDLQLWGLGFESFAR